MCFDLSVANVYAGGSAYGGIDEKMFDSLVFNYRL
jgi:hypothetical protein